MNVTFKNEKKLAKLYCRLKFNSNSFDEVVLRIAGEYGSNIEEELVIAETDTLYVEYPTDFVRNILNKCKFKKYV